MNIKTLVFKGPGTVVAAVEEHDDYVLLFKPVEVLVRQNEEGDFYVSFIPFLHFTEECTIGGIRIQKIDIMTMLTPVKEIIDHYSTAIINE